MRFSQAIMDAMNSEIAVATAHLDAATDQAQRTQLQGYLTQLAHKKERYVRATGQDAPLAPKFKPEHRSAR